MLFDHCVFQGPPDPDTAAQSSSQAQVRAILPENQTHNHQSGARGNNHSESMDYDMLNDHNLPTDTENNHSKPIDIDMLNTKNLPNDPENNHSKPMDNDMLNHKHKAQAGESNVPNPTAVSTSHKEMNHQSDNRFYNARVVQSKQVKPGTDHKDPTAVLQPTPAADATAAPSHERIVPITRTDIASTTANQVTFSYDDI